jgi:hypothetical protein
MTKTGESISTPPWDRSLSASAAGRAQQIEISAAHKLQAHPYQSNCPATQVMRFPGRAGRHTSSAEKDFGNLAIRRAGQMTIERAEGQHELLTLQARKRIGGPPVRLARQQSPEPQRGIRASSKIRVKREHWRDRRVAINAAHEQERESTPRVGDDPMLAVNRLAPEDRRQRAK